MMMELGPREGWAYQMHTLAVYLQDGEPAAREIISWLLHPARVS